MKDQPSTEKVHAEKSIIGISQILIGVGIILVATIAVQFFILVLAIALLVRGALDVTDSRQKLEQKSFGEKIIGMLNILAGLVLLFLPRIGVSLLSLLLAVLFILGGGQKLFDSLTRKNGNQKLVIFTGLISVTLGVMIIIFWPVKSITILGILVGIEILLNGMSIAVASRTVHSFQKNYRVREQH